MLTREEFTRRLANAIAQQLSTTPTTADRVRASLLVQRDVYPIRHPHPTTLRG